MNDIIEAGLPAAMPLSLSLDIFIICWVLVLLVIIGSFASYLERAPKRFEKIKKQKENLSPLEQFEKDLLRVLSKKEDVRIELPKLLREFLENNSWIPWISTKTLSEISSELPIHYTPMFRILEEIEFANNRELSEHRIEQMAEKLRNLAGELLTK